MAQNIENLDPREYIIIKGASMHNLKSIDLSLPHNKLIVMTGLSGSGKSTLAFDTLYGEGQRRYVESLSSYARQFLGRIDKPKVEYIKGIAPAVAIQQKVNTANPRSTVGTASEVYDYMKLLFARIGRTFSPVSGLEVKKESVTDVIDYITSMPEGTQIEISALYQIPEGRSFTDAIKNLNQQGYSRVKINGMTTKISDLLSFGVDYDITAFYLLIDRTSVQSDQDSLTRMADSISTAFYEGKGSMRVDTADAEYGREFSSRFEADGVTFIEPSVHLFSFNNPLGACPVCEGYGRVMGIDEDLVIPNTSLSVFQSAIAPFKGEKMGLWRDAIIHTAEKSGFPIHTPYFQLSQKDKDILWNGCKYFKGINDFFAMLEKDNYKMHYRIMLARYRGKTTCHHCHGTRLRDEAGYVRIAGHSIPELVEMPLDKLKDFFDSITLSAYQSKVAERLLTEIRQRLDFMCRIGLSYLTLNRPASTLSGGESQRINIATSLGSSLVGSLYVLDEPSIGLHQHDTAKLIDVLKSLRDIGNTVVVVEHDEDVMMAADVLVDIGPKAGINGGEVVFCGSPKDIKKADTLTAKYLNGTLSIDPPSSVRPVRKFIEIKGAKEHNLKNIDVRFPLEMLTVVTGVSGSGKSTLVRNILYPALSKILSETAERVGSCTEVCGDTDAIGAVELVDQNPIGKSSRSNPVTYVKAYDDIRDLFAAQKLSKIRGFSAQHFSFNVDKGRCPVCKGDGEVVVQMQFMADVHLTCEACGGRRFKREVLEVKYQDKNIADILDMTVDEAIAFFTEHNNTKIVDKLLPLQDVGMGYIHLGQPSSTLSGGEAQRIKLASFLGKGKVGTKTLFIFDEPTTGLHFHDIKKLLTAFDSLIRSGHSIIVIEHNPDVIKCADYVIDLGPQGGDKGGYLVFAGTPRALCECKESVTAPYIADKLKGAK
ncbi:MAG: excinuclease ABC subunit UvrA [Flavobacteriales bacterium]|nr:excinuclease ABC subunit UvrA [Flavobacteriales bacterium]